MAKAHLEEMSKTELIRELRKLQDAERRLETALKASDPVRLVHDLQVSQIELEMQNRELQEGQQLLEDSRSRYADLYDFAPVGYCTFDLEGYIQEINLTGASLLEVPREKLVHKRFPAVISIRDKDPFRTQLNFEAHLRACAEKTDRVTTEWTLSSRSHGTWVMQMATVPLRDHDGAMIGYRSALIDVTALKQLDRLRFLADAGEMLSSTLDYPTVLERVVRIAVPALADLCIADVLDENGRLQRLEVAFGSPEKQLALAERVKESALRPGPQALQRRVATSRSPVLFERTEEPFFLSGLSEEDSDLVRAIGPRSMIIVPLMVRRKLLATLTFIVTESKRHYASEDVLFFQDIARRTAVAADNARLHTQVQRAIRIRENLLGVVSHDLRDLLGVVDMASAVLLKSPVATDRRIQSRKSAEMIHRTAEKMTRLVADLLDSVGIVSGHLAVDRKPCPLLPLVREALEGFQAIASVRLECDLAGVSDLVLTCDRERILQVLTNLIGNAIKFSPQEGTVTVRAQPKGNEVWFSVGDTGAGIPSEELPHIFEQFWQAAKTSSLGVGLGLTIAKGIIEAHGGRIWAESEMGAGTTIHFTLPIARPYDDADDSHRTAGAGEAVGRRAIPGASSERKVVLVIDDESDAREAMQQVLALDGYESVGAANGKEALVYLRTHPAPYVILLDLVMPVMDGWAFLAGRNRDPALRPIPVIVISGHQEAETQAAAAHAGFIQKPVRPESLAESMEHMVHGAQ